MPEHNARNEKGRTERIVLVVNTQRNKRIEKRNGKGDITAPVKTTVMDNKICVIKSVDLYKMWLETLEGKKVRDIFDVLFDCEGIFERKVS